MERRKQEARAALAAAGEVAHAATSFPSICGHTIFAPPLCAESVVVDLGASTAAFSSALAGAFGCVCHAVEATRENFARIAATERVTKHHYAMGGCDGPVPLSLSPGPHHSGRIAAQADTTGPSDTVPGATLPSFMRSAGLDRIDLLKVDIEGAEIALFDAAPDTTLECIAQITVEFHDFLDPALAPDVRRVTARLRALGFRSIQWTRPHHGDVLFIHPGRAAITEHALLWAKGPRTYSRGALRRIARMRKAAPTTP